MGNPSLIAKLGLDPTEFSKGLRASEASLQGLQNEAKLTAAQIAMLEREMVGKGTDAQRAKHTELQAALRQTRSEAVATQRQLAALDALNEGGGGLQLAGNKRGPQGRRGRGRRAVGSRRRG